MESVKRRFMSLVEYSHKKQLPISEIYNKWVDKDYENENVDTDEEEQTKSFLKYNKNAKTNCKFCDKKLLQRNCFQHLDSCMGVQVFNFFFQKENPNRTSCVNCGKILLKRDIQKHTCKEKKNFTKCDYCQFNYVNHVKCDARDIVEFIQSNFDFDFDWKCLDVCKIIQTSKNSKKGNGLLKPKKKIYFTNEEYFKENLEIMKGLNAKDKLKKLKKDSKCRWYQYKGFYGNIQFLNKNKKLIDDLFNVALLQAHNSMLKACGFHNVKRPTKKIFKFNSLKPKRDPKKRLSLSEKCQLHPEFAEKNSKKRWESLKDSKLDFPVVFSQMPKPTKEEHEEFLKCPQPMKEIQKPSLLIKEKAEVPMKESQKPLLPIKEKTHEKFKLPTNQTNLHMDAALSGNWMKSVAESFRNAQIEKIKKEHDEEKEKLGGEFEYNLEKCGENDFYGGFLRSGITEEEIASHFVPDKIKTFKEIHNIRLKKEKDIISEHRGKIKRIKSAFSRALKEIITKSHEELINANKKEFEEKEKYENEKEKNEKEKRIELVLKEQLRIRKLMRCETNNSGFPQDPKRITWQNVLFRKAPRMRREKKHLFFKQAKPTKFTNTTKANTSGNSISDKFIKRLWHNNTIVGESFVEPVTMGENSFACKKRRMKELVSMFYKKQCLQNSCDEDDEILVPGSPKNIVNSN